MKQRIIVIFIAIVSVVALCFIGYAILTPVMTPNHSALQPVEDAQGIYESAVSKIDLLQDFILNISQTTEITVDGSVFLEISEKTVQYDVQPSGETCIVLHEKVDSGTHDISVTELFANDTVYLTVNDTHFMGTCTREQYTETLIPAIILTPQLYDTISGVDNGSSYIINFSMPVAPEKWLAAESAALLEARGVATVNHDGILKDSMYTATYQMNGITFRTTVHTGIEEKDVSIQLPGDSSGYTQISYWKGPKILERACGLLLQADRISSKYNDSIFFEAIGDRRTQNITLHAYNDSKWSMSMTTDVSLKNESKQDQESTYTKNELFIDNQYYVSSDDEIPAANAGITVDTIYNYFQDQLVSTILLPKDILTSDAIENENTLRICFTGTDAFAAFLTQNACQILYQNPNLIADTGKEISNDSLQCYLEIDSFSGLPIASGVEFSGHYKTEGLPYQLQYSAHQSYVIPSNEAQIEIEKAAGK